ncbi:unnamed protein product [Absidia cylindrospora]
MIFKRLNFSYGRSYSANTAFLSLVVFKHGFTEQEHLYDATKWLERLRISFSKSNQPFKYDYLLNLFTTPDMASYLSQSVVTDDVYALPIHLQRLLLEAKEEVVLARTRLNHDGQPLSPANHPALERLERVRSFCWLRSDADIANLMSSVVELVADDDELEHILMD